MKKGFCSPGQKPLIWLSEQDEPEFARFEDPQP
jgi:hypothetical protein